jgi:nitroreductase
MTLSENSTVPTQSLDVPAAIMQRRSIKTFKPDAIAPETLKHLVELTVAAPSSFNLQQWRIVLVQDPSQKAALTEASWGQKQILEAPVTFVFAVSVNGWEASLPQITEMGLQMGSMNQKTVDYLRAAVPDFQQGLAEKAREYAIKDAMIAATHLVLAAESLGLSTCFMNGWVEDGVKAVIGADTDPNLAIAVLVPVGYAAESRPNPGRLPFAFNVSVDRLDTPYPG